MRGGERPRVRHEVDGGIPEQQDARPHPAEADAEDGFSDSAERRAGPMSETQQDEPQRHEPREAAPEAVTPVARGASADGALTDGAPVDGALAEGALADAAMAEIAADIAADIVAEPEEVREVRDTRDPRDRSAARALFIQLRTLPEGSPERAELRNRLVRMHLPLVEHLARRFRNRGEPLDDLTQVATIGLIKSVDRFDPDRGVEFSTYATPTVVGEIKRHFRDKGWAVRVPRRLQELRLALTTATAELSQQHQRSPTVHELAERLGISEEEVLEGLESANAYSTLSLDVPDTDDESPAVADTLGSEDEALEGVEYRESLKPLLEGLPPREKRILLLRFFGNMTQSQIAQEVGISQMHVSRLLARTLAQLREKLLVEE
ncbi:RNA polymerase sigma factor SigF [Streptomyces sp. G-G2]|uniref:RNA polymerase sigma factor SigF n=1 Tax=Streptomyces sp. G-G2 TaxID=3046201 RepID=UPI0024B8AAC8|nr:RNA polymerase sigma factor SigF [Streptomyces sp. G-G2]MDJ0379263.1 RNA polymerase sigma factor SigF [Streptomyces sp. G-G2]